MSDKSDRFAIALASESNTYALNLSPRDGGGGLPIRFRPNTRNLFGYEFSYKYFAFAIMQKSPLSPSDEAMYGNTDYFDYRAILSFGSDKSLFLAAYWNEYKGFYIENTSQISTGLGTILTKRPDLRVSNIGTSLIYIWDPRKFSVAAAVFQTARQTQTGGSVLLMTSADVNDFQADNGALIPTALQSSYGKDAQISRGRFTTTSASIGYGLTLVASQSYFLTGIIMWGSGYQWRKYGTDQSLTESTTGTEKSSYLFSAGFNGEDFFVGGGLLNDRTTYRTESLQIASDLSTLRMFAGFRM